MKEKLQEMVNGYGFGISKANLATEIYWKLKAEGYDLSTCNDIYLLINGKTYAFNKTRTKGHWTVVEY